MKKTSSWLAGFAATTTAATLALASSQVWAADPITFGMMTESTGPSSEAGIYQANGAKLALDEINKAGGVLGRQIVLVERDDEAKTSAACRSRKS